MRTYVFYYNCTLIITLNIPLKIVYLLFLLYTIHVCLELILIAFVANKNNFIYIYVCN